MRGKRTTESVAFSLSLAIDLRLFDRTEGGRATPVTTGYRPLCRFTSQAFGVRIVGMCELELIGAAQVKPGESAGGVLRFSPDVEVLTRELAQETPDFELAEVDHIVGSAHVTAIL